jgi:hypothetical protein
MNLAMCELRISLALFTLTMNFVCVHTHMNVGLHGMIVILTYLEISVQPPSTRFSPPHLISHVSSGDLRARLFVFAAKSQDPKRTNIRAFR